MSTFILSNLHCGQIDTQLYVQLLAWCTLVFYIKRLAALPGASRFFLFLVKFCKLPPKAILVLIYLTNKFG